MFRPLVLVVSFDSIERSFLGRFSFYANLLLCHVQRR